jgi:uncharacterized protein
VPLGTLLNVSLILAGGLGGKLLRRPLSASFQQRLKVLLGVATVVVGLKLTLTSFHGSFGRMLAQLGVVIAAMIVGRLIGRLLCIQKMLNAIGHAAGRRLTSVNEGAAPRTDDGFKVATILFCAAPLSVLGAAQDGLNGNPIPLLLKAVMDGLVVFSMMRSFGWSTLLGVVPMAAWQLCLSTTAVWWRPLLEARGLLDPVNAVCGLLIFCVALLLFAIRRIAVGDYLPSLVMAPLLGWWLLR